MSLFPTTFLLGLAGFDIAGAIIIVTALSLKCTKKNIYVFALTSLVTTVLVGAFSAKVLGTSINFLTDLLNYIPDKVYAVLGMIIGAALLYWFIERVFVNEKYQKKEDRKESFLTKFIKSSLFVVGILFSLWAISDPSFWGVVALASQSNSLILIIAAFTVWMLVGQLPLYILTVGIAFNKHEKIIKWFDESFTNNPKIIKLKRILRTVLSVIILVAGIYFITDSLFYFFKSVWLF